MKLLNISPAALKALEAFNNLQAVPAPSFVLRTSSGFAADCATFTGAFRALHRLPAREQQSAYIFDEDGACLYR